MKRYFLIAAVITGLFCVTNVDSVLAGGKWGGFKGGNKFHGHKHNNWGGHKFHGKKFHNHKFNGGYHRPYYGGYPYGYGYGKGVQINTPGFSFGIYK